MDSQDSARIFRRRRFVAAVVALVAVVAFGFAGYSTVALAQPVPTASASLTIPVVETGAAEQIAWPSEGRGALGAVGFDGVLSSSGGEDSFPIASIAKIVTALVVLDHKPIAEGENGPTIEITDDDVQWLDDTIAEGGSWEYVVSGSALTQRQVLEAMMLPSANNYSKTLVLWAFGSMETFLEAAQTWLSDNGLTGTTLTNSSGLGASNVSTTRDLVEIGKLALANPVLAGVVAEKTALLPDIGEIENLNSLLGTAGITGMKTGTDDASGSCILFSAEVLVGDTVVTVVGSILGTENSKVRNAALLDVLASAPAAFERVQLATAGEVVGAYSPEWVEGASSADAAAGTDVVASSDASVLVWKGTTVTAQATAQSLEKGASGSTVGSLDFTLSAPGLDQGTSISVPLVLATDLEPASAWYRITNPAF